MWQIYRKELLELTRDRKTLMFVVLLPIVIFPLIFAIMGLVVSTATKDAAAKEHRYILVNAEQAKPFADALFYHKSFKKSDLNITAEQANDEAYLKQLVREDKVDVVIVIPADFNPAADALQQSQWKVVYNTASQIDMIGRRVESAVADYRKTLQQAKLTALGVQDNQMSAVLDPVKIQKVSSAEQRENIGEQIGGIIGYILIPIILAGAMYPAIDIGAGEKERGTLETLLICPVERVTIVLGKFVTVLTAALASVMLTVGSLGFWGYLVGSIIGIDVVQKVMSTLGGADLLWILLLLLPIAALFSALVLSLSIYARSFKEAQNYMTPLTFVVIIPAMMAMMPGMELNMKSALVPVLNTTLALKELVKGTLELPLFFTVLVSTVVIAIGMIAFCVHWFQREKVLFR
jgi:sodium transport system permease protein